MADKIRRSVDAAAIAATDGVALAGGALHHLTLGPGPGLTAEWVAAGLELPDLPAMRQYRNDRVRAQLRAMDYVGIIVMDPMNIRYATDTTNMQVWVMHNGARYAWVGVEGPTIVWDYPNCEFLSGHSHVVDEVRAAIPSTYFAAGGRHEEQSRRWAAELLDVIGHRSGARTRVAIDQCHLIGYQVLADAGVTLGSGQEVMELARSVKGPDEIRAMRCAVHACETTMAEMRHELRPGMTERDVWALLHAGNIRRSGEWIETQILSSGPRTNPWMQEASSRVIEDGDLVGYDTDLVGAYGMMVDISRTWLAGDGRPSGAQRDVHGRAVEQLHRNIELLTPGRSFRELTFDAWTPPADTYRHYPCLFHGVGQCDEYPDIYFPDEWDTWGYDGIVEPGMVLTVEAYVGAYTGGEGVKLENQVLVTEHGPQLLSHFPLDLVI